MSNKAFLSFFAVLSLIAFGSGYWMESRALDKVRRVIQEPSFVKEGLLAYYPLDGNASDATGRGNHGTMHGPPDSAKDRFGSNKAALYFDGRYDFITFDHNNTVRIPDPNQCSVAFWIKKDDSSKGTVMQLFGDILQEDGGVPPVKSYLGVRDGGVVVDWHTHSNNSLFGKLTPDNDGWNHVAVVFAEGKEGLQEGSLVVTMYLNGQKLPDISNPKSTPLFETEKVKKVFILGRQCVSPSEFRGTLDDVRIYSRSLSELEIENLYEHEKYRE